MSSTSWARSHAKKEAAISIKRARAKGQNISHASYARAVGNAGKDAVRKAKSGGTKKSSPASQRRDIRNARKQATRSGDWRTARDIRKVEVGIRKGKPVSTIIDRINQRELSRPGGMSTNAPKSVFTQPTVQLGNRTIQRTQTPDMSHITTIPQKPQGILDRVKGMIGGATSSLKGTMQAEQAKPFRQRIFEGAQRAILGPVAGTQTGRKLAYDIPKVAARSALSIGLESPLGRGFEENGKRQINPQEFGIEKIIGQEPIKGVGTRALEYEEKLKEKGYKHPTMLAVAGATGATALDLWISGGGKQAISKIAQSKSPKVIKTLLKGKVADNVLDDVARQLIDVDKADDVARIIKQSNTPQVLEVERVSKNLLKNNPTIGRTDAEAMARDVIANRKFNQVKKSPLIEEARKTYYHGGAPEIDLTKPKPSNNSMMISSKKGIYLAEGTPSGKVLAEKYAKNYGETGRVHKFEVANDARIFDINKPQDKAALIDILRKKSSGLEDFYRKELLDKLAGKSKKQIGYTDTVRLEKYFNQLENKGYDGMKIFEGGKENSLHIWNTKKLSQPLQGGVKKAEKGIPAKKIAEQQEQDLMLKLESKREEINNLVNKGTADIDDVSKVDTIIGKLAKNEKLTGNEQTHAFEMLKKTTVISPRKLSKGGQEAVDWTKNVDKKLEKFMKPRGFAKTVEKSNLAPKEISKQLTEDTYKIKPNEETASRVKAILELGEDNALKVARDANHPESNATALKLMEDALKKNEFQKFSMLNKEFSPRFTKQGQQIQIISKFGKLTPTGAVRYAEHIVEEANRLSGSKLKLTDEVMGKIKGLAEDVAKAPEGREKVVAIAKMMDKIAEQIPEGLGKKIATLQTMAQLLNPKTAIRNILGNVALGTTETVSDLVGTGIDKLLSVFPKWNRSMGLPSIGKQLSGAKKGFKLGMEDALLGIDTSGFGTKFDLPTRTFRKGLLDKLEKAMNIELRATDRAFYQGAFDDSINSMMKATKAEKATSEMMAQAGEEALYRTFQNNSALANAMVKLKKGLNFGKDFGIGDLINKYPKTPANIVNVGMDYSPLGVFKVAKQVYDITKGITSVSQIATRRNLVKQISRVLVGTGIIGTGYVLAKNKIVSGKVEKDKDISALQRISGGGPFKLNISALRRMVNGEDSNPKNGDLQISYDWLQPNAIPFSIGVNMALGDKKAEDALNVAIEGLESGVDTLTQQPVIQGVKRFAQDFSSKGLVRAVGNQLAGAPASFVPTLVNQMRQKFGNNITRETYDPNVFKEGLNRAMAKIPGLENKLPERINQLGEPLETYQGGSNSVINVFFNPAFVSRINESPEAKMVLDLYRTTGEKGQVPRIAPEFIKDENGNRVDMTPEQYVSFQKYIGQKTQESFSQLAQSKEFQSMSDVEKVNKLTSLLTSISADAKKEILGIGKGSGTSDEAFIKYTQELKSLNDQDFKKKMKALKEGTPEEQTMADTIMKYKRDDIAKEIGLKFNKKWSDLEQQDKANVLEEHINWLGDKEKVEFFKSMLDKDFLTDPQIKEIAKRGVLKPDDILKSDVGSGVKSMVLYETLKAETGDFFKDADDRQGAIDELNEKTEERLKDAITKLDMSPREKQAQYDSIVQGLKEYRIDDKAITENLAKEDERWSQMTVNDRAGVLVKQFTGMDKAQAEEKFAEMEEKGLITESVKDEFIYQWKKAKIEKIEELPSVEDMRDKPLSEMTTEELNQYRQKLAGATQSAEATLASSDDPTATLASSINIGEGTLAARNNNPGNLRYAGQEGASQGEGGFARFDSPEAGYEALKAQIELDASRGITVSEFVSKYAPPTENDTATYIKQFNASVGSNSGTKLASLDTNKVAEFMALKESSTRMGEKIASNPPTLNQPQTTLLRSVASGKTTEEQATQKVLDEFNKVNTDPKAQEAAQQVAVVPPKVKYNNIGYIPPEYFDATSRIYGLIASLQLLQSRWTGTAPNQII